MNNIFEFGIDNGELNDLTPQQCFALGWEVGAIYQTLNIQDPNLTGKMTIHSINLDRIKRLILSKGFCVKNTKWINDDWVEVVWSRLEEVI